MNVLDIFSGIGAFSLGLGRAGMTTVAFCECDSYCRRVLAKHWPEVPCYDDVRSLTAERLRADGISVDVICGGFPCQDISVAGQGAGITGERSGLWREFARLIGELRPRYALVENVSALLVRGLYRVLGDLAALGYDAEWHCIPAAAVGAPHRRDRIWIVAYPASQRERSGRQQPSEDAGSGQFVDGAEPWRDADDDGEDVADAIGAGLEGGAAEPGDAADECAAAERGGAVRDAGWLTPARYQRGLQEIGERDWWFVEPDVGRVVDGCPSRVDRLRALGNSLVPQIPELIGRALMEAEPVPPRPEPDPAEQARG